MGSAKGSKVEDINMTETNGDNQKTSKNQKEKYGDATVYDPTFSGPLKNRGCTDIICCALFLICFLGMGAVGYFAYLHGDPKLLLFPTDSDGKLCGYDEYESKPNLLFFDLIQCAKVGPGIVTNGCPTPQVCVESCPDTYWTWYTQFLAESNPVTAPAARANRAGKFICQGGVDATDVTLYPDADSLQQLIENGTCMSYYYPMQPVLKRCVPAFLGALANKTGNLIAEVGNGKSENIQDADNKTVTIQGLIDGKDAVYLILEALEYGEKFLADVENSKWFILIGLGISMVVSFFWIVLMRWLAGVIIWTLIVCFLGLFGFSSYYTYTEYYSLKNSTTANTEFQLTTDLSYYTNYTKFWLALGCTSATILIILLLIILFLRERIQIAIALIKEGSRAVGMMMFSLLWPIWPFIMQCALLVYWGATCIYLASSSKRQYANSSANPNDTDFTGVNKDSINLLDDIKCDENGTLGDACKFVKYGVGEYTKYLQIYMLFMLFWVMSFIIGFGQMALAGAFASYYWAFDKSKHMPTFPVLSSCGRTMLYHMGSIAFGSLIIAIIQMIRVGLEYLDAKLKGAENRIAKFLLKALKCCFYCLEKFMKMINKNAYILVAVYGKNFCSSAKQAFFLIMRNIVRVVVIDKVTDFLLFIGKLVVVAAITLLSYFFFNGKLGKTFTFLAEYTPVLNYFIIPVLSCTVISEVIKVAVIDCSTLEWWAAHLILLPLLVIIAVGAYVIASCFFSVYGMAVDTLFLCFLEDLERHDGSAEKPYYMSKELKSLLGKKNVKESSED